MTPALAHGFRIARVQGVPVFVHLSWLLVFVLVSWTLARGYFPGQDPHLGAAEAWARGIAAALLFFGSVLLHELAHSVVARRRGLEVSAVTLFVFGGVSQLARDPADERTELKVAAAGPLTSLVLSGLFLFVSWLPLGDGVASVAGYLAFMNLVLALFNLVPAFPLDGGRLLRAWLWRRRGKVEATRIAAGAGILFAYTLIALGAVSVLSGAGLGGLWYVLLGLFLKEASAGAWMQARTEGALAGMRVRDAMHQEVETLPAEASLAEAVQEHFLRSGHGAYPVRRGESVVGLLRLPDVLRHPAAERDATSVQGAMAPLSPALVAGPDEPLGTALQRMAESGAGRLLVLEGDRLVGLLTLGSVLRLLRVRDALA